MTVKEIDVVLEEIQTRLNLLVKDLKEIQIGSVQQFPFGWRKAAKGRTVWRILEEAITQNLEANKQKYGFSSVTPASSEVGISDMSVITDTDKQTEVHINIKSAVSGRKSSKDDLSKAQSVIDFVRSSDCALLFIATFVISFHKNMTITIEEVIVYPINYLDDIYVNPSNNGNLQSSSLKDVNTFIKRNNQTFSDILEAELGFASRKKVAKKGEVILNASGKKVNKIKGRWTNVD